MTMFISSEIKYSFGFILNVILTLCTRIKETINFVYFLYKNTITYTSNHISTNRKINYCIKLINFVLKIENNTCNEKISQRRDLINMKKRKYKTT